MVPQVYTAYRLWVDGKEVIGNGVVGTDAETSVPKFLPRVAVFTPDRTEMVITLQVSNFHHVNGGIWSSISFGTADQIIGFNRTRIALDMIAFGGLLLIGFYHLVLYLFRRRDQASLFFGLFCLITALRVIVESNRLLVELVPAMNWELNEKLSYLTYFFMVATFNLYLQRLLPD